MGLSINNHRINTWDPEDEQFWVRTGRRVARRNLVWSVLTEHLGFTLWTLWSVVAVKLGAWHFSVDQLFWLVALPNLVGAAVRVPYTFAPARFGGRNWTVVSTLLLLVPAVLLAVAVRDPHTPYWAFLLIAATAGLGGGNFASSMANITHFYGAGRQGVALGINAAGGNVGVSSVQLLAPLLIASFGLVAAGLVWVPLILLAAAGAWLRMDNLATARSALRDQVGVVRRGQTWLVSVLYIGTFGSFIGYATALPLLTKSQFPDTSATAYAFAGPLIGSLARPVGGWLADRYGGANVTLWNFLAMGGGVLGVLGALRAHDYPVFLAGFAVLFVTAGIGNGSTYRMIPAIFRAQALRGVSREDADATASALTVGRRDGAAVLGLTSAVGALGGFGINRAFGYSIAHTGNAEAALVGFAVFYAVCFGLTWFCYLRRRLAVRVLPSLADARV
ncbi:MFS transporter [Longispora sp. K20-0274]|uniref:MFS transporter n=1 Tax=Longispora sp. K20-0274 TaxID=3088255 RepID=UPI00399B4CDF